MINLEKIKTKPIFLWLKKMGLEDKEMLKTFNCGIGFCVIAKEKNFSKIYKYAKNNFKPYIIGKIIRNKNKIVSMKKLNGNLVRKINIAVFISGKGSNLLSIIKKSLTKESLFKVSLVLSNKKNVKGLLIAKNIILKL